MQDFQYKSASAQFLRRFIRHIQTPFHSIGPHKSVRFPFKIFTLKTV